MKQPAPHTNSNHAATEKKPMRISAGKGLYRLLAGVAVAALVSSCATSRDAAGPRAAVGSPAAAAGATSLSSPFNVWNRRPELADRLQRVGEYIRFKSSLPA